MACAQRTAAHVDWSTLAQYLLDSAGSLYRLRDGQELALSVPGCLDPCFELPYSPTSDFPEIASDTHAPMPTHSTRKRSDPPPIMNDASLSWPSSSNQLHNRSASPAHHQSAQNEAEINRLVDGALAENSGSFGASVTTSNSNSVDIRGPTVEVQVDRPVNAHFMAVAAKLIYEAPEIVTDCLEHRCSAQCHMLVTTM